LADAIWPTQRDSSRVLDADDCIDRSNQPPRVRPLDRLRKQTCAGDRLAISKLLLDPGATVAARDPHLEKFAAERVVVALPSGQ
jgi:hypothetical protein